MFIVFAFGFETHINNVVTDNRLISEAVLNADHVSIRCHFSSSTYLTGFW